MPENKNVRTACLFTFLVMRLWGQVKWDECVWPRPLAIELRRWLAAWAAQAESQSVLSQRSGIGRQVTSGRQTGLCTQDGFSPRIAMRFRRFWPVMIGPEGDYFSTAQTFLKTTGFP